MKKQRTSKGPLRWIRRLIRWFAAIFNQLSTRITATALIISIAFGTLVVHLANLQLVRGDELQQKAINQQMRDTVIDAARGTIYDANGEVLAQSATVWNVFISPNDIRGSEEKKEEKRWIIANGLAEILDMDPQEIYEKTLKKSYQIYLKRRVESDIRAEVLAFESENPNVSIAIGLEETTRRYYPNGQLAATVLGFTGNDGQGLAGLESYYDDTLTGIPGRILTIKNAVGTEMDFEYEQRVEAQNGNSLVLGLDKVIQGYLEKHLDRAIEDYDAKRAVGIVLNVNTFEILGMATRHAFDPNDPFAIADKATADAIAALPKEEQAAAISAAQNLQWRNTALNDTYEPGSVFKAVTAAAALDEGAVNLTEIFKCPGYYYVGGWRYKCFNYAVHGPQNVAKSLQNSCNIAFIQIGAALGAPSFCRYYSAFGLTERTGVDLPGEVNTTAGVHYHSEKTMGVAELASSSFGQSQKVTALQMITAMATVVNGGYLGTPHLVKQILDANGNIVSTVDAGIRRQVISGETSAKMALALESVVTEGGGKNAAISGYRIGGKTGTAEKLDTDNKSAQVVSFCGFAPVDDPEVACIVVIDEPREGLSGSMAAAPLFRSIMEEVLPYMGVERTGEIEDGVKEVSVSNVISSNVKEAEKKLTALGLKVKVLGSGEKVMTQYPAPETLITEGGIVYLFTDKESQETLLTVPDFTGMTVKQANKKAAEAGLNIRLYGNYAGSGAKVVKQSIVKDSKVTPGTIITLNFLVETAD